MASIIAGAGQKPFAPVTAPRGANPRARLAALFAAEQANALLFAPILLGAGIALWFILPLTVHRQAVLLGALAAAVAGLALRGMPSRLLISAGLLVALGICAAQWRSAEVAAPRLIHRLAAADVTGTLIAIAPREGGASATLLVRRDASSIDPAITVRLGVAGAPPPGLKPGARLAVRATLGPLPGPALPGAHDPARRAWFLGISATGRALGPVRVLKAAPTRNAWLSRVRLDLAHAIDTRLGGDAGAIAVALIIGEQGLVRPDLLEAMRVAGLAHILTVSGYHIGIAVAGVFFLLRHGLALWPALALRTSVPRIAAIGAGLAGTGYALLSGGDVPAIRAAIVAWIVLIALMLGRDPVSLRLVAFAAFVILLVRPEALLNPSFQLSFAAVTALVALARSSPGRWLTTPQEGEGLLLKAGRLLLALVITGIVAELVLTPIALVHFGRAGAYGVLANLVAIPLTSFLVMPLLGLWLILSAIGLGSLAAPALILALEALAGIGTTVAAWPGATWLLAAMPATAILPLLAGAFLLMLFSGPLRWAGPPLLLLGVVAAFMAPRPDLLVSADGRQVGVIAEGRLHTLRGHRGGFLARSWAEQSAAPAESRLSALPGARCTATACAVPLPGGVRLLAFFAEPQRGPALEAACAASDIVTASTPVPGCRPRWLSLDPASLRQTGAIAIHSRRRVADSVAARAGDHAWSPAALPGTRPRLLGSPAWTGVIAE